MADRKSDDSRRKLLKSIAAGSGAVVAGKSLPESWSKPVIESVVLPAHARATDDTDSGGPEATTTPVVLCGGCYETTGGGSSVRVPEGSSAGTVLTSYLVYGSVTDCSGPSEQINRTVVVATRESEAAALLNCGSNEVIQVWAIQEGSECALWECFFPD